MKPRFYLIALVALFALVTPAAFAQRTPADADSGQVGQLPDIGIGGVSRVFTNAYLVTPDGTRIGKAKTASVTTSTRSLQALRIQVSDLTPNAEYAIVIDNTLVGTATASASGTLKLKFSDPAGRNSAALPEAIRPIATVQTIAIYEVQSQRLVASGQFSADVKKGRK